MNSKTFLESSNMSRNSPKEKAEYAGYPRRLSSTMCCDGAPTLSSNCSSLQPPSAALRLKSASGDTVLHLAVTSVSDNDDVSALTEHPLAGDLKNVTQTSPCEHLPDGSSTRCGNTPNTHTTTCAAVSCGPCQKRHVGPLLCGGGPHSQRTGGWLLHLLHQMSADVEATATQITNSAVTSAAQVQQQARSSRPGPAAEENGCQGVSVAFLEPLDVHPVILEVVKELRIMRAEQVASTAYGDRQSGRGGRPSGPPGPSAASGASGASGPAADCAAAVEGHEGIARGLLHSHLGHGHVQGTRASRGSKGGRRQGGAAAAAGEKRH
ncbi:hypothetical protein Vafri_14848 [Volvox africanus]|uniref:Uncharacterized protein n=1 Tax=Volvox africanus TaxID=51714 RepID=A0A8J4BFS1_9CHLO|nr:hypothetical protein Vafri_14848 [Volvox africanus]